jgi:hypothetical protein
MNCQDTRIKEMLPDYASGNVAPSVSSKIRAHLEECSGCRDELRIIGFLTEDCVPEPAPGFWSSLPGRVTAAAAGKRRKSSFLPVSSEAWAVAAAAVIFALILGIWPSSPPDIEDGMLAEYFLGEAGSYGLGIEGDILPASGLMVADVDLSPEGEIGIPGEMETVDVLGSPFTAGLYHGMDEETVRILEKLIEDMTPDGVERG